MTDTKLIDATPVTQALQALIDKHGTQQAVADLIGVNQSTINLVLHGLRAPGKKILGPLGMVEVITYRKAARA